jgi:hypothetical protein
VASNTRLVRAGALALIATCVISRLPQLLSPNLLVDGDEATLGLMARHLAHARELPVFFWGQRYGLSTIEAGLGAVAFVVAGTGAVQLKVAMLALWTAGVVFLFLAQVGVIGLNRSLWITALIVLGPGWAVWSMKARGGYLTAFAATAMLIWLLAGRQRLTTRNWVAAGVLIALAYVAQPLWVPGAIPFVLVALLSPRSWRSVGAFAAGAAGVLLLAAVAAASTTGDWNGTPIFGNEHPLHSISEIAQQIYVTMTGAYYLWFTRTPPGTATVALALFWSATLPALLVIQLYRVATRRFASWSHVLFASLCATLLFEFITLGARDARYMLPLLAPLVMLAGFEWTDLIAPHRGPLRATAALTAILLVAGAVSVAEFRRFSFLWTNGAASMSESARLKAVASYLKAKDISHVYAMNGLLESELTFYTDEQVIARWTDPLDRHPAYPREVDRALAHGLGEVFQRVGHGRGS